MDLEDRLKTKLVTLYSKLDSEMNYINDKKLQDEIQTREKIYLIKGFLLGCSYIKTLYNKDKI